MTDNYIKPESASLKARLRKRSDDDRKIQANNEAVAAALRGQRLLFEQGVRSDSNTFAMRLCMDYERCARNDDALAEDWAEAADRIEELEEALTHSQAEVAAAYERAAEAAADYPRVAPDYDEWSRYDEQIEHSQKCIRALATTEQTAALDTIRAEAREQGMRDAAELMNVGGRYTIKDRVDAILAAIAKKAKA